jgi:hypothetical protein
MRQIDANKGADCLSVVNRIFDALVRQAKALLGDIHSQDLFQAERWTSTLIALRIARQQSCNQGSSTRRRSISTRKRSRRVSFFVGEFGVGKARLLHRECGKMGYAIVPAWGGASDQ